MLYERQWLKVTPHSDRNRGDWGWIAPYRCYRGHILDFGQVDEFPVVESPSYLSYTESVCGCGSEAWHNEGPHYVKVLSRRRVKR